MAYILVKYDADVEDAVELCKSIERMFEDVSAAILVGTLKQYVEEGLYRANDAYVGEFYSTPEANVRLHREDNDADFGRA